MATRFELHYDYNADCHCRMVATDDGGFVHYPDYEKLVIAAQEAIRDLELDSPRSAKRNLSRTLLDLGEAA